MKTRAWDGERFRDDYVVMPDGTLRQLTYNKNYAAVLGGSVDWKLSRFTGQLDEDGTEIYENSIVECCIMDDINMEEGIVWGPTVRDVVIFDTETGMFRLSKHKGIPLVQHTLVEFIKVIGDIFTTPELPEEVNK